MNRNIYNNNSASSQCVDPISLDNEETFGPLHENRCNFCEYNRQWKTLQEFTDTLSGNGFISDYNETLFETCKTIDDILDSVLENVGYSWEHSGHPAGETPWIFYQRVSIHQ